MSVLCGVCNKPCVNDASDVKCVGTCKKLFHVNCVKEDGEGRKLRSGKDWMCKNCRNPSSSQSGDKSSSSNTVLTKDVLIEVMDIFKKEIFNELQIVKNEVTELKTSVNFLSNSVDVVNNAMKEIQSQISELKKENKQLKNENIELQKVSTDMKERLRALEQYTRKNNIEISGIPETAKENVLAVVKDIGTALGLELQESQVAAAHRIPSFKRDRPASLVVQFQDRTSRDIWISKYKERKTITARDVNQAYPPHKVFVNEHLSPENKLFLNKLKQKTKDLGIKYVWCRDGKFYVRRADGESCKRINTYDELDKLR